MFSNALFQIMCYSTALTAESDQFLCLIRLKNGTPNSYGRCVSYRFLKKSN